MTLHLWVIGGIHCAVTGLLFTLLTDNIRLRRRIHQHKVENAERAARALGDGLVLVDGVTLPSPDDARWKTDNHEFIRPNGERFKDIALMLGEVVINAGTVFVGAGRGMPRTEETKRYVSQVETAYRSRLARKSLEGAST